MTEAIYEYSPAGELLRSEGSYALDNHFRFATKYQDDELGLIYFGQRYYSPCLGRFINRDPIEESGGANLYAYCANDLANAVDTLGLLDADLKSFGGGYGPIPIETTSGGSSFSIYFGSSWDPFNSYGGSYVLVGPTHFGPTPTSTTIKSGSSSTVGPGGDRNVQRGMTAPNNGGFWGAVVMGLSGPSREEMELRSQQALANLVSNAAYGATIGTAISAKNHWDAGNVAYLSGDNTMMFLHSLAAIGDVASLGLLADGAYNGIRSSFASAAESKLVNVTADQAKNLARFEKSLPGVPEPTVLRPLPNGGVAAQANVPGRVPGSFATYEKQIDATGKTIQFTKTTVDPAGNIIHIKDKISGVQLP